MASFIVGCIVIVTFIFTFSIMVDCTTNAIYNLLCYFRSYINETHPTTRNYWTNMNLYKKYFKELKEIDSCLKEKREKMGNLCCIINASKNISDKLQAEKDYKVTVEELRKLGKYRDYIIYPKVQYYNLKAKEITKEMNRRGMWELSS